MECKFCNKECKNKNSLRNHERLCKLNPNHQTIKSNFVLFCLMTFIVIFPPLFDQAIQRILAGAG